MYCWNKKYIYNTKKKNKNKNKKTETFNNEGEKKNE